VTLRQPTTSPPADSARPSGLRLAFLADHEGAPHAAKHVSCGDHGAAADGAGGGTARLGLARGSHVCKEGGPVPRGGSRLARPTEFPSMPGSGHILMPLERVKK